MLAAIAARDQQLAAAEGKNADLSNHLIDEHNAREAAEAKLRQVTKRIDDTMLAHSFKGRCECPTCQELGTLRFKLDNADV